MPERSEGPRGNVWLSRHRTAILIVWAAYSIALVGTSLVPAKSVPAAMLLGWDKLAHAMAFLGLAVLTFPLVMQRPRWTWLIFGYGILAAVLSELLQISTPGRTFSIYDMIADMIGVSVCVLGTRLWAVRNGSGTQAEGGS